MSKAAPPPDPRETLALLGHAAAEHAFLEAWISGRLAHAWLICGPRGIGKATFAYRIARFVLSAGGGGLFGSSSDSLDVPTGHPGAHRIAAGGHADLKVIERGFSETKSKGEARRRSEIVVDDVRGIGGFMSLTPAEGGWRVVIIDAADEMNRNAANAVLKVLEEPPAQALLLLLSHSPGRLLPTIRSRCRRLNLAPLAEAQVQELLGRLRPDLSEPDVRALARMGEGSIGRSLALAAEGGLDLYREVVNLLSHLPRLDITALHAFGDRVSRAGAEDAFRTLSDLFTWWLARMIRLGGQGGGAFLEVVPGESEVMSRLLSAANLDQWVEVWENITHLFTRADALHLDRKQVILNAFLMVQRGARPAS